jgi:hypothetical protein
MSDKLKVSAFRKLYHAGWWWGVVNQDGRVLKLGDAPTKKEALRLAGNAKKLLIEIAGYEAKT